MQVYNIPEEVWIEILARVSPQDFPALGSTCHLFHRLVNEPALWEKQFRRRFGSQVPIRQSNSHPTQWKDEYMWRADPNQRVCLFNADPERCIEGMLQDQIIHDGRSMALFLRRTRGISHKQRYKVVARPQEYGLPEDIFRQAIRQLDVEGLNAVDALRLFSKEFGNIFNQGGQEMSITSLAQHYYESNGSPVELVSPDQTFVLMYSIVMLNTDAHNPKVPRKLSCSQFIHNMRNVGVDLSDDSLSTIYREIQNNKIENEDYDAMASERREILPPADFPPLHCGWGKVKEERSNKKRWLMLAPRAILIYKKKTASFQPNYIGAIRLFYHSQIHVHRDVPNRLAAGQLVVDHEAEKYLLGLGSEQNSGEWENALIEALTTLKNEAKESLETLH